MFVLASYIYHIFCNRSFSSPYIYIYIDWINIHAILLSYDDSDFDSYQLCGHEQGLLNELVQLAVTVLCQSTAACRTLTFIGIVRAH